MWERKRMSLVLLFGAMILFGIAGIGNAALYEVTWNPADFKMTHGNSSEDLSHWLDLTTDGFNPGSQTITDASYMVTLYDNSDSSSEKAKVYISDNWDKIGSEFEVDGTSSSRKTYTFAIPISLINQHLQNDGATYFDLYATTGNFYFDKVTLSANTAAPVPEPGTMMLLGSGLVGLAGWGRKKFRK